MSHYGLYRIDSISIVRLTDASPDIGKFTNNYYVQRTHSRIKETHTEDGERIQLLQRHLQTDTKINNFAHEDHVGCLKDPHQQSMKVVKIKSTNHEVFKTSKIIQNGSLSMILGASEHHNKKQKK